MLLSERWHGYGLRNWSRGRCFLVGGVSRVFGLVVVVVGMPVLLPAGASTEGMWQTASDWSLCRRIRSVAGIRGARVRCSLLLILCVLVCTAIPAAASADRIAFTKYPATLETTGIWTADAATGENQVQIKGTAGAGWPALSPSGIRIAYLANEGSELYVINTDGTGKRKLTTTNGGQIGWSPDGKDVVFTRGLPERRVYVVNVSNGEERSLGGTPGYYENYPCWSRDGRYIAFRPTLPTAPNRRRADSTT